MGKWKTNKSGIVTNPGNSKNKKISKLHKSLSVWVYNFSQLFKKKLSEMFDLFAFLFPQQQLFVYLLEPCIWFYKVWNCVYPTYYYQPIGKCRVSSCMEKLERPGEISLWAQPCTLPKVLRYRERDGKVVSVSRDVPPIRFNQLSTAYFVAIDIRIYDQTCIVCPCIQLPVRRTRTNNIWRGRDLSQRFMLESSLFGKLAPGT